MKTLVELIRDLNLSGQTAANIATTLNNKSIVKAVTTPQTIFQIGKSLSKANRAIVSNTIDAQAKLSAVYADFQTLLRGPGLDLSAPESQEYIDEMATAGSWSNNVKRTIKELGLPTYSIWTNEGYVGDVTTEQCQTALTEYLKQKKRDDKEKEYKDRFEAARVALSTWDTVSEAPPL